MAKLLRKLWPPMVGLSVFFSRQSKCRAPMGNEGSAPQSPSTTASPGEGSPRADLPRARSRSITLRSRSNSLGYRHDPYASDHAPSPPESPISPNEAHRLRQQAVEADRAASEASARQAAIEAAVTQWLETAAQPGHVRTAQDLLTTKTRVVIPVAPPPPPAVPVRLLVVPLECDGLLALPPEALARVLGALEPAGLCALAQCSRECREVAGRDVYWKALAARDYESSPMRLGPTWKGTYQFLASGRPAACEELPTDPSPAPAAALAAAVKQMRAAASSPAAYAAALASLATQMSRLPRIRLASPALTACGPAARGVLRAAGMVEERGCLVAHDKVALQCAREQLELLVLDAELAAKGSSLARVLGAPELAAAVLEGAPHGLGVTACTRPDMSVATADTIGRRPVMEDEMVVTASGLLGLFDGHGGRNAAVLGAALLERELTRALAKHLEGVVAAPPTESPRAWVLQWAAGRMRGSSETLFSRALRDTFATLHETIVRARMGAGTTALVLFVTTDGYHYAHVGDSRALLVSDTHCVRLTTDHRPSDEAEARRVLAAGGRISQASTDSREWRVNGELGVTRALGSRVFEPWGLVHTPDYGYRVRRAVDRYVVLGCDGLWDVVSDQTAAEVCLNSSSAAEAAAALRDLAFQRGSGDNVSVVVACVERPPTNFVHNAMDCTAPALMKVLDGEGSSSPPSSSSSSRPSQRILFHDLALTQHFVAGELYPRSFSAAALVDLLCTLQPGLERAAASAVGEELASGGHIRHCSDSAHFRDDEALVFVLSREWHTVYERYAARTSRTKAPRGPPAFLVCPVCYVHFPAPRDKAMHLLLSQCAV